MILPLISATSVNAEVFQDRLEGTLDVYTNQLVFAPGEPIFVPKNESSREGEGYLIALAYLGQENRSDLMIFDAENVSSGPLARAMLPHRIPYGFHGNWRQG